MSEHHRQSVLELWFKSVLFNEIAYGKSEDILDDTEYRLIHWLDFDMDEGIKSVIDYIYQAIPTIIKNILQK